MRYLRAVGACIHLFQRVWRDISNYNALCKRLAVDVEYREFATFEEAVRYNQRNIKLARREAEV